ncbi:glycosyltransferase [Rhodoflexus sp.]
MDIILQWLLYLLLPVQALLAFYLLQPLVAMLGYKAAPKKNLPPATVQKNYRFAAIVTIYQDSRFILPIVDSLLRQTYPHVAIYVVADDCAADLLPVIADSRVRLLVPPQPLHSKVKSIAYALANFGTTPDALVIFDADNLVHRRFFERMNTYFNKGYRAVMGHIKGKQPEAAYARMDELGEIMNNFLYRKASMAMGCSSAIDGKGFVVAYELYRQINFGNMLGGFDKKLQLEVVRQTRIAYADEAVVYDEKVSDPAAFQKQRTRWIYTYFRYWGEGARFLWESLSRFKIGNIYFGLLILRPPVFILLGCWLIISLLYLLGGSWLAVAGWLLAMVLFMLAHVGIFAVEGVLHGFWQVLGHIPSLFLRQVRALLKMDQANRSFLATDHHQVLFIEDIERVQGKE